METQRCLGVSHRQSARVRKRIGEPLHTKDSHQGMLACGPCFTAKAKCRGGYPCARCFRYCLPCRPRMRKKELAKLCQTEPSSFSTCIEADVLPTPFIELGLKHSDPLPIVERFVEIFGKLLAEGLIRRDRVMKMLRTWRATSFLAGTDVTWGLSDIIADALGISFTELENAESVTLDMPEENIITSRRAWAKEEMSKVAVGCEELRNSDTFRLLDNGVFAVFMYAIDGEHEFRVTNTAYGKLHKPAEELTDETTRRRSLPVFYTARLVAHEDRDIWMRMALELIFTDVTASSSHFIKVFDRNGEMLLTIMRAFPLHIGEGKQGHILCVEPAPVSRYVTDRPDVLNQCIVRGFRTARSLPEVSSTEMHSSPTTMVEAALMLPPQRTATSADTNTRFCGLSTLPLDLPSPTNTNHLLNLYDPKRLEDLFKLSMPALLSPSSPTPAAADSVNTIGVDFPSSAPLLSMADDGEGLSGRPTSSSITSSTSEDDGFHHTHTRIRTTKDLPRPTPITLINPPRPAAEMDWSRLPGDVDKGHSPGPTSTFLPTPSSSRRAGAGAAAAAAAHTDMATSVPPPPGYASSPAAASPSGSSRASKPPPLSPSSARIVWLHNLGQQGDESVPCLDDAAMIFEGDMLRTSSELEEGMDELRG